MMSQQISDIERRLANLASYGTIAAVDHAKGLVRVDVNGRMSGWLPQPQSIGNNYRAFSPLRIGQQVVLACPSGDPANGVIVQSLNSDALPPPGDAGDVDRMVFNDGTVIGYDSGAKDFTIDVNPAGSANVRVGQASVVTTKDEIALTVGGSSIKINAGGIYLSAPTIGMAATNGDAGATLDGDFQMRGRLGVTGDVQATGSIIDAGGNSNHHSH